MRARRVALGTGVCFAVIAVLVRTEFSPLLDLDRDVTRSAVDLARDHETYRDAMKTATWLLHSQLVLLYAAVVALGLADARRPAAAVWLAAVVGVGTVVNPVLKVLFDRERPVVPEPVDTFSGLSFPSGHAASAGLICAALAVLLWPRPGRVGHVALVTGVAVIPLLSGWTRLTLGAHFLSDVVAGVLWSVAWVAAWQPALPALERRLAPPRWR
ncbi:phosphatase PAP2 family protein [Sporichthya brevicatena]|uniref:Phosphatase PAP2 family protein n=1 Tax=Sporichthya brevicatena TaxID=171442 RepID=A0ABN1GCR8_9ACTN